MGDRQGFIQKLKSVQLEADTFVTRKTDCGETKSAFAFLPLAAGREIRHARSRHRKEAPTATSRESPRDRAHGGGDCHDGEGNGKRESNGVGRSSRGAVETRTSTRSDHLTGALSTYHPHLARGGSPTGVKRWRSLPCSTRRATRRSAEPAAASRSCHTRIRCSFKWLPGDLALTVRPKDCYRMSCAGFDRIARPRTLLL